MVYRNDKSDRLEGKCYKGGGIMEELKTSAEWVKEYNVKILDPDGWDRRPEHWNYSFNEEKITRNEFDKRLIFSTIKVLGKIEDISVYIRVYSVFL